MGGFCFYAYMHNGQNIFRKVLCFCGCLGLFRSPGVYLKALFFGVFVFGVCGGCGVVLWAFHFMHICIMGFLVFLGMCCFVQCFGVLSLSGGVFKVVVFCVLVFFYAFVHNRGGVMFTI